MTLLAGFGQAQITPPLGSPRVGWCWPIAIERILDPIYARVCLLESQGTRIAIVSLDVLSVRWTLVCAIRDIACKYDCCHDHVMVCATHNHAGPAVASVGPVFRDDHMTEIALRGVEAAFIQAVDDMQAATLAQGQGTEGRLAFCRRGVMADGSTRCHPPVNSDFLHLESISDPSVGVMAVRARDSQKMLGILVNFACHPTFCGDHPTITADWPGQLSMALSREYGPKCVTLLLNGAFGDVYHRNYLDPNHISTMELFGNMLGSTVRSIVETAHFVEHPKLRSKQITLSLSRRDVDGPWGVDQPHPQLFLEAACYQPMYEKLRRRRLELPNAHATLQCLSIGDSCRLIGIPAEFFAELGLAIKEDSLNPTCRTWVVGGANGMVGYVPLPRSFVGGGYECTLATSSKLVPDAGQQIVDAAKAFITGKLTLPDQSRGTP